MDMIFLFIPFFWGGFRYICNTYFINTVLMTSLYQLFPPGSADWFNQVK